MMIIMDFYTVLLGAEFKPRIDLLSSSKPKVTYFNCRFSTLDRYIIFIGKGPEEVIKLPQNAFEFNRQAAVDHFHL